jgi:hypothetical protein
MKKIMLMARDPGGANTVLALVPALQNRGYEVRLLGKDAALQRYRHFQLPAVDITRQLAAIDIENWSSFTEKEQPDFIITGTSGDDFSERYLWAAARQQGIPCFAILDQWINFGLRFSAYGLNQKDIYEKEKTHPFLPDRILVMDEEARREMIREGIDEQQVLVSGQPYFDLLLQRRSQDNEQLIKELRESLGIARDDYAAAFISESISQDYEVKPGQEAYWGYDEKSIFMEIAEAMAAISRDESRAMHILIKKHPLEQSDNYQELFAGVNHGGMKALVLESNIDPWGLLLASDLVIGMSSMMLLEAILLGKPALSVQIGLKRENPFILDKRGILTSILDREDLLRSLRTAISGNSMPGSGWQVEAGAIERIIELMEGYICRS